MSLRRKITIILYILSVCLSVFVFSLYMSRVINNVEANVYSDYATGGTKVYYSQNFKNKGLIFELTGSGKVLKTFSSQSTGEQRVLGITTYQDEVYAVLAGYYDGDDDEDKVKEDIYYRIVCLDESLNLKSKTIIFSIDEDEVFSRIGVEASGIFMTMLSSDGSYARVYSINKNELKSLSGSDDQESGEEGNGKGEKERIRLDSIASKRSGEGRFFSDAGYMSGQIYARSDKDAPEGMFEPDPSAVNAVSRMSLSMKEFLSVYSTYFIFFIAGLLVWFVVLFLITRLFSERNRTMYFLIISEMVLVIMLFGVIYALDVTSRNMRIADNSRFAVISLLGLSEDAGLEYYDDYDYREFYDTEDYQAIRRSLTDFVKRPGNKEVFYDVFVMRLEDSAILTSASGHNLQTASSLYGTPLSELDNEIYKGNMYAVRDIVLAGQDYRAVAVADSQGSPDYCLVGIINISSTEGGIWVENRASLILFILAFAIGSAGIALVWFAQTRNLRLLERALSDTALGRQINERPEVIGSDLKDMWDSVTEINKRIEEIQYSKLRILEAYYRFAPKNVEKILGRESILEVKNGDNLKLSGSIGTLGIDTGREKNLKILDGVLSYIGEYQKENGCIVVGKAPDISRMQLLFLDSEKQTVKFFTEMFNLNNGTDEDVSFSAFLYHNDLTFGVIGSEEEATTYLHDKDQVAVGEITTFITRLSLGLVISEDVKERENVTGPLRFIGRHAVGGSGKTVDLYEVLDAHPAELRKKRMRTLDKYNEALNLFYEKDFYIARTKFSEILKDTLEDNLIKWYVFESDRYLNEGVDEATYRLLHN